MPDVLTGYDEWLSAFWELSTERQIGFAAGPIPGSAILTRCKAMGIDDLDEVASFRGAIRAMDRIVLDSLSEDGGQRKSIPTVASRPLDMKLFDAIFG